MVELDATEFRAFRNAGILLSEVSQKDNHIVEILGQMTFPLVDQLVIEAMKKALETLVNKREEMSQLQKYKHNDICSNTAHLKALKQ